jgi:YHS domain-containing protein
MEALIYFAVWAVAIFLMMRFGCGAHVMGHSRRNHQGEASDPREGAETLRWIAPKKAVDPVCGKSLSTADAKPSVVDGFVYYFCSRECREVFEAAPELYVGEGGGDDTRQVEHSHA